MDLSDLIERNAAFTPEKTAILFEGERLSYAAFSVRIEQAARALRAEYGICRGDRVAILSLMVPFVWVTPSWTAIGLGIVIGVASTVGQWIIVLAYRYGDASVLAPFSYTQLLWVSILGFFLFGEVPDVWTVTGAAFIVASGLYIAHRERIRRAQLLVLEERSPNP